MDNCPLITDASLEHLKSCHSLDRIELYDCQQITRAGIKRLRVSCGGRWGGLRERDCGEGGRCFYLSITWSILYIEIINRRKS